MVSGKKKTGFVCDVVVLKYTSALGFCVCCVSPPLSQLILHHLISHEPQTKTHRVPYIMASWLRDSNPHPPSRAEKHLHFLKERHHWRPLKFRLHVNPVSRQISY